jgi:hypothetical protein
MLQCITCGSLMLVRRTFTAIDHQSTAVIVNLSAAISVYRGDLPSRPPQPSPRCLIEPPCFPGVFPYLRSTAGEPLRLNTAAVVELYRRRLGSSPFHPLRSTPTITSPPAKPAQAPWSSLASPPSPPATTITGIWPVILGFLL